MRKITAVLPLLVLSAFTAASVCTADVESEDTWKPPDTILGVKLEMDREEVERRLARLGERVEGESEEDGEFKQLWQLRHRRYQNAMLRFGHDDRLMWITAFAREDGPRLRYADVADTSRAKQSGRYIYSWTAMSSDGKPEYMLVARGTGPEYLSSISLTGFKSTRHTPGTAIETDN